MNPNKFFAELRRRHVYRAAAAYAVIAWLLIQIATQVFPFFEIPNWAVRFIILILVLGFPIVVLLAWLYELTPEGIVRAEDVDPAKSISKSTGRKFDFAIIGVLLLVIAMLIYERFQKRASLFYRSKISATTNRTRFLPTASRTISSRVWQRLASCALSAALR